MRYCSEGHLLQDGETFCRSCGSHAHDVYDDHDGDGEFFRHAIYDTIENDREHKKSNYIYVGPYY